MPGVLHSLPKSLLGGAAQAVPAGRDVMQKCIEDLLYSACKLGARDSQVQACIGFCHM